MGRRGDRLIQARDDKSAHLSSDSRGCIGKLYTKRFLNGLQIADDVVMIDSDDVDNAVCEWDDVIADKGIVLGISMQRFRWFAIDR